MLLHVFQKQTVTYLLLTAAAIIRKTITKSSLFVLERWMLYLLISISSMAGMTIKPESKKNTPDKKLLNSITKPIQEKNKPKIQLKITTVMDFFAG